MEAERRSTLASLKGQLAEVGGSVKAMRTTVVVGSVLTVACLAAVFGVTLLANETSKESHVKNGMLVDRSGKLVSGATVNVDPFKFNPSQGSTLKTFSATMPDGTVLTSEVISFVDTGAYKQYTTRDFIATIMAGSDKASILPASEEANNKLFEPIWANMGGKDSFTQFTEEDMDDVLAEAALTEASRKLQQRAIPGRGGAAGSKGEGCNDRDLGMWDTATNGRIQIARANGFVERGGGEIGKKMGVAEMGKKFSEIAGKLGDKIKFIGITDNALKFFTALGTADWGDAAKALASLGIALGAGMVAGFVFTACTGGAIVCAGIALMVSAAADKAANATVSAIADAWCDHFAEGVDCGRDPCEACTQANKSLYNSFDPVDCMGKEGPDKSAFAWQNAAFGLSPGYSNTYSPSSYGSTFGSGGNSFSMGSSFSSPSFGFSMPSAFSRFSMAPGWTDDDSGSSGVCTSSDWGVYKAWQAWTAECMGGGK